MISAGGENLIFIFSLPRSGSTLLSAILGNHQAIFCPPEPWVLLRLHELYGEAAENKIFDDYLASKAVKSFLTPDEFILSARSFALTAYNAMLTKQNSQILVDKTPRYYHILDFIQALFPESKKIWLKRNPLSVAASYKSSWNRGIDYLVGDTLDPSSFDLILGLSKLAEFFDQHSPYTYEIKYEDLVYEPEDEIKKLAAFCGLAFEPTMLDISQTSKGVSTVLNSDFGDKKIKDKDYFDTHSIHQWKDQLDGSEIRKLTAVIGSQIFKRMGYDDLVKTNEHYFNADISENTLEKVRKKMTAKFDIMKTVQIAAIYDYEAKCQVYENQLQTSQSLLKRCQEELQDKKMQLTLSETEKNNTDTRIHELENLLIMAKVNDTKILLRELQEKYVEIFDTDQKLLRQHEKEITTWTEMIAFLNENISSLLLQLKMKELLFRENQKILEEEIRQLNENDFSLKQELQAKEQELHTFKTDYAIQYLKLQEKEQELLKGEEKYQKTRHSLSYKLGRTLLWPFIKLKKSREN